jgi:hypothetical protein
MNRAARAELHTYEPDGSQFETPLTLPCSDFDIAVRRHVKCKTVDVPTDKQST